MEFGVQSHERQSFPVSVTHQRSLSYASARESMLTVEAVKHQPLIIQINIEKEKEMSIGQRLRLIFETKGNAALDAAEDPTQVLNLSYEKQLEQLQNLRRAIAQVMMEEKHIDLLDQQAQAQANQLISQAQQALQLGREDLARQRYSVEKHSWPGSKVTKCNSCSSRRKKRTWQMCKARLRNGLQRFKVKKKCCLLSMARRKPRSVQMKQCQASAIAVI
jgi:PspA/IM30 family